MAWIILVVAGLFEVAWSFALKLSQGFTQPVASVATIVLMLASFLLLAYAMKSLPLGTAYAVWTAWAPWGRRWQASSFSERRPRHSGFFSLRSLWRASSDSSFRARQNV